MENMELKKNFWSNKKVLITGHTGFKGTWLSLILAELGAKVQGISSNIPTSPSMYELLSVSDVMETDIRGDICETEFVSQKIKELNPEIVFHLAAESLVIPCYQNPIQAFKTNIIGSANILQALLECSSVRAIVNITTDKCYKNKEWDWPYRENDELGGKDPYSASKSCSEIVSQCYWSSFFSQKNKVGLATARAGNIIGGGDFSPFRLVPDIFRCAESSTTLEIRNPEATRPWQHVLDPLHGYMLLAKNLFHHPKKFSEAWNFGPATNDIQSVKNVLNQFKKSFPKISVNHVNEVYVEQKLLLLDSTKSCSRLGWKPQMKFEEAVEQTAEWYKVFLSTPDEINSFTTAQINRYLGEKTNNFSGFFTKKESLNISSQHQLIE